MRLERSKDKDLIKSILTTDGLWESISDEIVDRDNFDIDVEGDCWLLISNDDYLIGCYKVEARNISHIDVHTNILPEHRKEHSLECGLLLYNWIIKNKNIMKLTVAIPVVCENVRNYCLKFGLIDEGLNRASIIKNGELVDQWTMGITRNEIEDILNEFN